MTDHKTGPANKNTTASDDAKATDVSASAAPDVALDPEILANLDNSISVKKEVVKSGWSGVLYETICNTPLVITASVLAASGNTVDAFNTASGLVLVIPIYAAMGASIWVPGKGKHDLVAAKQAYEATGDTAYVDLVSAQLAESLAKNDVPHIRGDKRQEYKERFNKHRADVSANPLSQRVRTVSENLRSAHVKHVPGVVKSSLVAVKDFLKTVGKDIGKLRHAPKDSYKAATMLTAQSVDALEKYISIAPFDVGSLIRRTVQEDSKAKQELLFLNGGVRDLLSSSGVKSVGEDFRTIANNFGSAVLGHSVDFFDGYISDGLDDEEEVVGKVKSAQDARLEVDRDHLDRTVRNIETNNVWQKRLMALNVVGIGFEMAFIKKYFKDMIHKGAEAGDTLSTSWAEADAASMNLMETVGFSLSNASGDIGTTAVAGISGVLMATCAWHHMVETYISANEELNDAASKWSKTVSERRELDEKLARLTRHVNTIFDPEITDYDVMAEADEKIKRIAGGITPRSIPAELREKIKIAQERDSRMNSGDDEFPREVIVTQGAPSPDEPS